MSDVKRYTAMELRFATSTDCYYVSAADYDALRAELDEAAFFAQVGSQQLEVVAAELEQLRTALDASAEPSAPACGYSSGDWECRPGGYLYDAGTGEGCDPQDCTYICPQCRTKDFLESAKEDAEGCSHYSNNGSSGTGLDIWKNAESLAMQANPTAATKTLSELGPVEALDGESVVLCNTQSAPVEIDERAEFERSIIRERTNDGYSDVALTSILDRGSNGQYQSIRVAGAWEGWQARAALERKP